MIANGLITADHIAANAVSAAELKSDALSGQTFSGNVTLSGNLTVSGTQTTVSSTTITAADPLIALASTNNSSDAVDIGFYGLYDTSGSQDLYAGLFRDAGDSGKWKLFKDLQSAPTTTVNTGGTGYTTGTLVATLEGNSDTATALASGRTIGMTGDVVWTSPSFDGSGNVTAAATIQANAVESAMIAENNITAREIAINAINATRIIAGSITTAEIAANTIATGNIADNAVDGTKIAQNSILTRHIDDGQVDTAQLAADAVDGTKIADDAIDSEHYTDGSIDTAHIADNAVTSAKIAQNSILTKHIDDAQVDSAQLAANAVTAAKIAANAVAASEIAANAVSASELKSDALSGQTFTGNVILSGNLTTQGTSTFGNATTDITNAAGLFGIQDTNPPQKLHIDEVGGFDVATLSTTSTGQTTLDSVSATTFRTVKWLVSITNSTDSDYQALEILAFHDGSTAYLTQYASIFDNGAQATFDADINSGNLRLRVTPASTDNMTFKVIRQAIEV